MVKILDTGSVGIGTTNPNVKLDVTGTYGDPAISGTSQNGIFRLGGTTGNAVIDMGQNGTNGTAWIQSTDKGNLGIDYKLALNPNGGNVGIGTTNPGSLLTVAGAINSTDLLGGATTLSTDANGNIIRTPSDERLKTNIVDIAQVDALQIVLGLRGVKYEWLDKERFGDKEEIGFLAQEVDLLIPEVVRKGGEYWTLNTPNMLAVVVEAMKEMWSAIQGNQSKIADLEAENERIKARLETLEAEQDGANNSGEGNSNIVISGPFFTGGDTADTNDTATTTTTETADITATTTSEAINIASTSVEQAGVDAEEPDNSTADKENNTEPSVDTAKLEDVAVEIESESRVETELGEETTKVLALPIL